MRDLTAEDRDFLVDYCMKPENTWLALAVGQVQLELKTAIVSSFVEKLDKSVKDELEKRGLNWKRTIPKTNLEKEGPIYMMTMKDPEIEIQFLYEGGEQKNLYVGTPVSNGDWPIELKGFLEREDLGLKINNKYWHWWFDPAKNHKSIGSIEALSKLNEDKVRCEKIAYFTAILVSFAEAISKELEA